MCVCGVCAQFADASFDGLHDNLLLFVHDQSNVNVLQRLTSASQLSDGALVEVVLSGNMNRHFTCQLPCIPLAIITIEMRSKV